MNDNNFKNESNIDIAKNNVMMMIFLNIVYLLNYGFNILGIIFLSILVIFIYIHRVKKPELSDSMKNRFIGAAFMYNSLLSLVFGLLFGNFENMGTIYGTLIFYILFFVSVLVIAVKYEEKEKKESSKKPLLASGVILSASASGLIISRLLKSRISYDVRMVGASIFFIVFAFILLLGLKFIVISFKNK